MNTQNSEKDPLPGTFDDQERHSAGFIWKKSAELKPIPHRYPSQEDTEQALLSVHKRLGWTRGKKVSVSGSRLVWISAAALILISFGIGYLFTPHTHTVPYGEQAVVELPDGSSLELNSGTTIRYSKLFGKTNRVISLDGEAFVTVSSHRSPAGRQNDNPFIIRANHSIVEVTGTAFNVRSRSDDPGMETRVHVSAGSVALYPAGNPDRGVRLEAGTWSRWNESMEVPMMPEAMETDEIAGWRMNRFTFRNESLGSIFREIERRFDVRIQLEADNAASEILTAHYIDPERPEHIIEDICHVKGLRYSKTANGFRIYR